MAINFIITVLFFMTFAPNSNAQQSTTVDVDTDIFVHEKLEITALEIPFLSALQSDVLLGSDVESTDSFCVYSNTYSAPGIPYPEFQFGATSSNGTPVGNSGHFISKNGNHQIEYYVSYSFNSGGFVSLTEGMQSNNISMENTPNATCGNGLGNNVEIKIMVPGDSLAQVPSETYSDLVTIDVFPPL